MHSMMLSSYRCKNIVALVTGGGSGLGAAATASLLKNGACVVVADLSTSNNNNNNNNNNDYNNLHYVSTDVTDPKQVNTALDVVEEKFGEPVNAVINCAGIAIARKTLSKNGTVVHPLDEFTKTISVNTVGTFNVATLAAQRMCKREIGDDTNNNLLRGCIINTASIAAYEGQIGQVAYASSKGAIVSMTLPMARDLAQYGIRVMTIAPGLFATPLLDGLPDDVKKELGASVPCPNRLGKPEEFGKLVIDILCNPMLNGSVIRLDGALRMPP